MESRMANLETKVDKFSELFTEVITNQKLMHQEIILMSSAVREISALKLQQVSCMATTEGRLSVLEDKADLTVSKFKWRDTWTVGGGLAIIGYLFRLAIIGA